MKTSPDSPVLASPAVENDSTNHSPRPGESCQDARLGWFVESFGFARMIGWGFGPCLALVSVRSSALSAWTRNEGWSSASLEDGAIPLGEP